MGGQSSRNGGGGALKNRTQGSISTNLGKGHHKNDQFYIAKRGLFRKAEGVGKKHNSDVFIVVH